MNKGNDATYIGESITAFIFEDIFCPAIGTHILRHSSDSKVKVIFVLSCATNFAFRRANELARKHDSDQDDRKSFLKAPKSEYPTLVRDIAITKHTIFDRITINLMFYY